MDPAAIGWLRGRLFLVGRKVDATGYSGIIVVLLGIAADEARTTVQARDAA